MIGPPHPVSNLRLTKFKQAPNETQLEKKLRVLREDTLEFHQKFWTQHNTDFTKGRQEFVKKLLKEKYPNDKNKSTVSANEMSVFYKSFLNSRWKSHLNFFLEWQKRNFTILVLGIRVKLQNIFKF